MVNRSMIGLSCEEVAKASSARYPRRRSPTHRDIRVFPIIGTAVMALGLYLMSTMGPDTGPWLESLYMFVLGLGIGASPCRC
ncbi:hypothetical protein [Streptomyces sp. H27-D2]|uniref:hypothetical protein n=1 Tax=Streptomyces sp. H27-D2 TaxID=3046304 RepID=UPI002DBFDE26|nr:hypothetical protein [Streptomyces sp. H27-D2]MEC4015244.1 hypothetical protein [Streptomyces sp. H27-D2]